MLPMNVEKFVNDVYAWFKYSRARWADYEAMWTEMVECMGSFSYGL